MLQINDTDCLLTDGHSAPARGQKRRKLDLSAAPEMSQPAQTQDTRDNRAQQEPEKIKGEHIIL